MCCCPTSVVFFFNDTATTEIYTLSLHDALPIWGGCRSPSSPRPPSRWTTRPTSWRRCASASRTCTPPRRRTSATPRSEEHTSELQSRQYLVCRLLLEKKKHSIV